MSQWKVSRERVEILPHFNADALDLAKVGNYQIVVKKGEYKTGDTVIFVPEKSVLPDELAEDFRNYLAGPNKDRVKSVRLRGEVSCGIALPDEGFEDVPIGEDISSRLGITKYIPPIPISMSGDVEPIVASGVTQHDVEHFGSYESEFIPGERVIVTEKVHGTQGVFHKDASGAFFVTSKGLCSKGLCLKESEGNLYWRAAKNTGVFDFLALFKGMSVQLFGEVIPCQKGFSYGQEKPTIRFFDVRVDGESQPFDDVMEYEFLREHWVPVIFDGAFHGHEIRRLAKGNELVSGQERHIREGVVVRPSNPRRATDGTRLFAKILNPQYRETGEELE